MIEDLNTTKDEDVRKYYDIRMDLVVHIIRLNRNNRIFNRDSRLLFGVRKHLRITGSIIDHIPSEI